MRERNHAASAFGGSVNDGTTEVVPPRLVLLMWVWLASVSSGIESYGGVAVEFVKVTSGSVAWRCHLKHESAVKQYLLGRIIPDDEHGRKVFEHPVSQSTARTPSVL